MGPSDTRKEQTENDQSLELSSILLFLSIVIFLLGLFMTIFHEELYLLMSYLSIMPSLGAVLLIFLAAFGIGSRLLMVLDNRIIPGVRFGFLSFCLGLGFQGLLVLFLGAFGLLRFFILLPVWILLLFSGVPGFFLLYRETKTWLSGTRWPRIGPAAIFAICLLVVIIMIIFIASLPLPVNYDVLEYHLGSVTQSLREGSIKPQPHVFYSCLPFGVEALYAAGMVLEGGESVYTPKLINFGILLLAGWGVYILLGYFRVGRFWRFLGVILFYSHNLVFNVSIAALVEPGQALYVIAAIIYWKYWMNLQIIHPEKSFSQILMAGIFWGLALGVKWSILGIGIIPFFIFMIPAGIIHRMKENESKKGSFRFFFKEYSKTAGLSGIVILFVFLPWMIRSFVHTGNPVFPFLSGIFRWDQWTPAQMDFYMKVNRAAGFFTLDHLKIYLDKWHVAGPLYILPIIIAFFFFRKDIKIVSLGLSVILGFIMWNLFVQPPARFLVPIVPMLVVIVVVVLTRLNGAGRFGWLFVIPYLLFVTAIWPLRCVALYNDGMVGAAAYCYDQEEYLDKLNPYKEGGDFINNELPADSRLFFIYEARTLYIHRPVTVNTVFDKSPLLDIAAEAKNVEDMRRILIERGYTHILVNEIELNRFLRMYSPKQVLEEYDVLEYFQDPRSNLTFFSGLYGPYLVDPRYPENREKIKSFMSGLSKRAIFERNVPPGLSFYIAPLK